MALRRWPDLLLQNEKRCSDLADCSVENGPSLVMEKRLRYQYAIQSIKDRPGKLVSFFILHFAAMVTTNGDRTLIDDRAD